MQHSLYLNSHCILWRVQFKFQHVHHLITSHFNRDAYILINIYVPDLILTWCTYQRYTVKTWAKFLSIKLSQYFLTQLWAGYITKCIIHKFYQYLRKKYISGELSHKSIYLLWIHNHSNWTCWRKFFISGSINAPLL